MSVEIQVLLVRGILKNKFERSHKRSLAHSSTFFQVKWEKAILSQVPQGEAARESEAAESSPVASSVLQYAHYD